MFLQHLAIGGPVASNDAGFNRPYHKVQPRVPVPGSPVAPMAPNTNTTPAPPLSPTDTRYTYGVPDAHTGPFVQDRFAAVGPQSNMTFSNPYQRMLLDQANGKGDSVADARLQMDTDANIRQAMALGQTRPSAGGYGASLRNILQTQAETQQQGVGQMGLLRAQEQMDAERLGTQNENELQKLALQQSQGNQQSTNSANAINSQTSLQNAQMAQSGYNATGQAINNAAAGAVQAGQSIYNVSNTGGSTGSGTSGGTTTGSGSYGGLGNPQTSGPVGGSGGDGPDGSIPYSNSLVTRRYASGGDVEDVDPYSDIDINGNPVPQTVDTSGYTPGRGSEYVAPLAAPATTILPKIDVNPRDQPQSGASKLGDTVASQVPIVGQIYGGLKSIGSLFSSLFSGGGQVAPGSLLQGGPVPGRAKVEGDSPQNDTVPTELSPGEVVLPRSVTEADDAPDKAKAFMDAVRKSKAPKPTFGDVLQSHRNLQGRVAQLEALCRGGMA